MIERKPGVWVPIRPSSLILTDAEPNGVVPIMLAVKSIQEGERLLT